MIPEIDKAKLVLVHDASDIIQEQALETKQIGYYHDSWNRFKKNKASLVAFYIIIFIFLMIAIGPILKIYQPLDEVNQGRLEYLPAKIPGLEKLGIFDGTKKVTKPTNFIFEMERTNFGLGIVKEVEYEGKMYKVEPLTIEQAEDNNVSNFPAGLVELITNADLKAPQELTIVVDYYRYLNYYKSYMPEDYFGIVAQNEKGTYQDPYASVKRILDEKQFADYLSHNYIIDILQIIETPNSDPTKAPYLQYVCRVDQFLLTLDQTPANTYFWFGTTGKGQDLFTELWKGARISLLMALVVIIINSVIGLTIGAVVGYYGGVLDLLFDRFVDILSSIPFLSVLMLMLLAFGSQLWVIVIAFTMTGWIGSYGTGRMQFYRFKNREYVLAARTLGASDGRIMFKHIFPNTLGLIVTGYALAIPSFVFSEASYSFLGIINYQDVTSVGMLINQGQANMRNYPHLLLFPALYISILMIAFNLFGNGLRDAFNPSLRGVE